jgi:hypothetical protein
MRDLMRGLIERLPLQFRVLYRQFLLRVVDLESLSIEADIPRLVGQFAGVLVLISVFQALGFLVASGNPDLTREGLLSMEMRAVQSFLARTMLIAGLAAVATWDNIFPDRRDAMVLGPLPVRPRTILAAKLAASGSLLAIGVLSLNCGMGTVLPLVAGGLLRFPWILLMYWSTVAGAAAFVFGAVLTVQGLLAASLPQRWFLRVSAILQLAGFAMFLSAWLFQPSFGSAAEFAGAQQSGILSRWPVFWFFGMFCQTTGIFPIELNALALRAWFSLAAVGTGAVVSLLLCYLRTMKKTVEEPDLAPRRGAERSIFPGDSLESAVVRFSMRSLARSRQHRVVYAFFLAIAFAIALSTLTQVANDRRPQPVTPHFLMSTFMMMCLAVAGLRSIFSLPVALKANWVLQVTQLSAPLRYIAGTRQAVLVMATVPAWLAAAGLSLFYHPWHQVIEHMLILVLAGAIMTDAVLIGVSKIPFACSYLPGKSNVQYMFWAFVIGFIPLAMMFSRYEQSVLDRPLAYTLLIALLLLTGSLLWVFNRHKAKTAVLRYEESESEVITTIGIGTWQPFHEHISIQNH